jgi:hypothetical protein
MMVGTGGLGSSRKPDFAQFAGAHWRLVWCKTWAISAGSSPDTRAALVTRKLQGVNKKNQQQQQKKSAPTANPQPSHTPTTPTAPRVARPRREPLQSVYTPCVARVRNDPDRLTSEVKCNKTRATRHKKKRRTDPRNLEPVLTTRRTQITHIVTRSLLVERVPTIRTPASPGVGTPFFWVYLVHS